MDEKEKEKEKEIKYDFQVSGELPVLISQTFRIRKDLLQPCSWNHLPLGVPPHESIEPLSIVITVNKSVMDSSDFVSLLNRILEMKKKS